MIALLVLATALGAFLGTFIHSRRVTEASVIHAAATSLVYGLVEQIKGLDYNTLLPSSATDPDAPVGKTPPYVRLRVNQDLSVWLMAVYTAAPGTPAAPTTTPAATATAASLSAIDNVIGPLPLSTATGSRSQQLSVNIWLWIDEIPSTSTDVEEVKKITIVYTTTFNDGLRVRSIRDREVVIRSRYDQ
ncbi:MAG: hypothetical protein JNL39_15890 [Opitutaceae bacterium]|nr:hypothetical protein [Opitutaceae bacterium]